MLPSGFKFPCHPDSSQFFFLLLFFLCLGSCLSTKRADHNNTFEDKFADGQTFLEQGKINQAIQVFEGLHKERPGQALAIKYLAQAYAEQAGVDMLGMLRFFNKVDEEVAKASDLPERRKQELVLEFFSFIPEVTESNSDNLKKARNIFLESEKNSPNGDPIYGNDYLFTAILLVYSIKAIALAIDNFIDQKTFIDKVAYLVSIRKSPWVDDSIACMRSLVLISPKLPPKLAKMLKGGIKEGLIEVKVNRRKYQLDFKNIEDGGVHAMLARIVTDSLNDFFAQFVTWTQKAKEKLEAQLIPELEARFDVKAVTELLLANPDVKNTFAQYQLNEHSDISDLFQVRKN